MEIKKMLGFGALAAGGIFLLSSFTNKSGATTDTGGNNTTTPGSGNNCSNPDWVNASTENWMACQSATGNGSDPATPAIVPAWDNCMLIGFVSPVTVSFTFQVPKGTGTITETYIVYGYSITQKQYITNRGLVTAGSVFQAKIPSWFVPNSSSISELSASGKIKYVLSMNTQEDWTVRASQPGQQWSHNPIFFHTTVINQPNMIWRTMHDASINTNMPLTVFGFIRVTNEGLGSKNICIATDKGIVKAYNIPSGYAGLAGMRSSM